MYDFKPGNFPRGLRVRVCACGAVCGLLGLCGKLLKSGRWGGRM